MDDALQLATESSSNQFRLLQRFALATFYFMSDQQWRDETGWLDTSGLHECDWFGITCEEQDLNGTTERVVTEIKLPSNNVRSGIPADFALLGSLAIVELHDNGIQGGLPTSLNEMASVVTLDLEDNEMGQDLTGFSWANLTSLENLYLAGNSFSGALTALEDLSELNIKILHLGNNNWTAGSIPIFF